MSIEDDVDAATGSATTGHVWDGDIKELNKPLPRWWLYTFYVTIVWSVGYWVAYPAWPLIDGYTKGTLGYSQRETVRGDLYAALQAQSGLRQQLEQTAFADVRTNADLFRFATASGAAAFATNCAPCHGRGAQGAPGYPNLNDDDWVWGGSIEDIYKTIRFGIRSDHKNTLATMMPRFGVDKLLEPAQIQDAAEFVLSLSALSSNSEAAARGSVIFAEQCAACHGEKGQGNQQMGAPKLADAIWLYGSQREDVMQSISIGRGGKMPAWTERLDEVTIKSLAIYVQSLGGSTK